MYIRTYVHTYVHTYLVFSGKQHGYLWTLGECDNGLSIKGGGPVGGMLRGYVEDMGVWGMEPVGGMLRGYVEDMGVWNL